MADHWLSPAASLAASRARGKRTALSLYRISGVAYPLQAVADRLGTTRRVAAARIQRARRMRGAHDVTWESLA